MFDYLFFIAALAIPFLISNIKTYRKGLVTGLFLSLLYWGKIVPILILVPLGSVLCVYLSARQSKEIKEDAIYVKILLFPCWRFLSSPWLFSVLLRTPLPFMAAIWGSAAKHSVSAAASIRLPLS